LLAAREIWPGVNRLRLAQLIQKAESAGAVVTRGGVAQACAVAGPGGEDRPGPGALRAVVVDVEAAVRASAQHPGGERRIYQVGAVRLSADVGWVNEAPEFEGWLRLPDTGWEALVRGELAVAEYQRGARDAVEVLGDFREWLGDADVLVAFNGVVADFPWIDAECVRAGLPAVDGVRRVDALYVVHTVWPWLDSYRLGDAAAAVGVEVGGGRLHDALVDARVTSLVLAAAAREVVGWPASWWRLVSAAGAGSAAWDLVGSLAGGVAGGAVDD